MAGRGCFGPLTLDDQSNDHNMILNEKECQVLCLLCDEIFTLPLREKSMLTHFFVKHRLVIADVNLVADLKAYVAYWKIKFKDAPLAEYCTTLLMNEKPNGTQSVDEKYYLLGDILPEDKELRANLKQNQLESLLARQKFEREDVNYQRECLFCRHKAKDSRYNYLKHLYEKHNFHIAKPENLIYVDKLIEAINIKLEGLKCIFCEKTFKDRIILKEHMRKKGHKRINPLNKEYDKYFLSNYLEESKINIPRKRKKNSYYNEKKYQDAADMGFDSNVESDPEWSDWTESDGPTITCLFCKFKNTEYNNVLEHMNEIHSYNFDELTNGLNFYQKIKIVNYIRRQIHLKECISCDLRFDSVMNLEKHIRELKHFKVERKLWDQPEFYFSTYEDDLFLSFIQDENESWWSCDELTAENDKESDTDRISKEMALAVLTD